MSSVIDCDKNPKYFNIPSAIEKNTIYDLYKLIHKSHFFLAKKRSLMCSALDFETWSWRVVLISEEAVKEIARNNFNKPVGKLERDHTVTRAKMYGKMFEDEVPMPIDEWWNWFWENDKTTLMTTEQHRNRNARDCGKTYAVDPALGYFVNGKVAGWNQTQAREGAFIRQLCETHSISY